MDEAGIPLIEAFSIHERWILLTTGERLPVIAMLDSFSEETDDESEVAFLMADWKDQVVMIHIQQADLVTIH